ncbi:glycosyltransferase [Chitinibacter tainanensis]|uniref:glycosyltransferase n=1 Tax=Chitinibacter tainanensis TaxID=230667 RepID=UPI0023533A9A|nr:glycosyltransferase [Chitinibacter tainanensis]
MSHLRVALVIDQRVPVLKYGGTERMVTWIAQQLLVAGHQLILVAPQGSALAGALHWQANTEAEARQILQARQCEFDIVHLHGWHAAGLGLPALSTLHGNLQAGEAFPIPNWVCISADHAQRHGRSTYVHNGLPIDEYPFASAPSRQALFFSKVKRKSKGAARALALARKYNWQLDVAGGSRFDLIKAGGLFDSFSHQIHFHGEVGGLQKLALLQQAQFMLFPIEWEEPFGLAVVESMLCGTPVLATPRGSMPELVRPSVTGQLCQSDADFALAAESVQNIDRLQCREYAAEHFSIARCVERYLALYQRVLQGEVLP